MPSFTCYRCSYQTDHKTSMYSHLTKNIKCSKNIVSLKYSDDEIIKYSLCNSSSNMKFNKHFKIKKTTHEFIHEMKNIYNSKRRFCNYCSTNFSKLKDLENHLFECIEIINNENINQPESIDLNININNINNNNSKNVNVNNNFINSNIYNNINNNIHINLEIPKSNLVSFNEDWNTEHIDKNTKMLLFLSTVKYTKTLEYLLENDINKNVLIDNDSKTGLIYKGDSEKFEKMKIEDIIDESMSKLYKHLKDFHLEIENTNNMCFQIDNGIIKDSNRNTKMKFDNFQNNDITRKNVSELLTSIFSKHSDITKQKYLEMAEQKKNELASHAFLY